MKYRKKPVVIDAWHWEFDGTTTPDAPSWVTDALGKPDFGEGAIQFWPDGDRRLPDDNEWSSKPHIVIGTLEGVMRMLPGEWLIRGIKGELYPCKPDIFAATYEPVEWPATMPT